MEDISFKHKQSYLNLEIRFLVLMKHIELKLVAFEVTAMPRDYGMLWGYYILNLNKLIMAILENCKELMSIVHKLSQNF